MPTKKHVISFLNCSRKMQIIDNLLISVLFIARGIAVFYSCRGYPAVMNPSVRFSVCNNDYSSITQSVSRIVQPARTPSPPLTLLNDRTGGVIPYLPQDPASGAGTPPLVD